MLRLLLLRPPLANNKNKVYIGKITSYAQLQSNLQYC